MAAAARWKCSGARKLIKLLGAVAVFGAKNGAVNFASAAQLIGAAVWHRRRRVLDFANGDFTVRDFSPIIATGELREYCQWESFNASCGPDEVILMQSAHYGRIRFGRCMQEDHGNVGCSADVLSHLDRKCSGRRQCHLTIPDAALHSIHPCPKELMPYLEASYFCVKGE